MTATNTLERPRLELVSWCHLPPVSIQLVQPVTADLKRFPSVEEGFETLSIGDTLRWSGDRLALVDISGLIRQEVEERAKSDFYADLGTETIRFLQCLEFLSRDDIEKVDFERIAAYPVGAEPVVAVRSGAGFKQAPYPGDEVPWAPGTLGLLHVATL
jgi:hypothetical protein